MPIVLIIYANDALQKLSFLETESKAIQKVLSNVPQKAYELKILPAISSKDLLEELKMNGDQIEIIHYSGHADGNELALAEQEAQGNHLAEVLKHHCPNLKLLFLNGCNTQGQVANYQKEGVPYIIATNTSIKDDESCAIATEFYEYLAKGKDIEAAFQALISNYQLLKKEVSLNVYRDLIKVSGETTKPTLSWDLYTLKQAETYTLPINNISLPPDLADNIITDSNRWVESIGRELAKYQVRVKNRPLEIFQYFGWLIECFLQKMETKASKQNPLRRLSFMAEAYQSSLRYLCFIQLAQLWRKEDIPIVQTFFELKEEDFNQFDFRSCLQEATAALAKDTSFIPEIQTLVEELFDSENDLHGTALFLEQKRTALLLNKIKEDEQLPHLLDEYLTALVYWLRKIAFLANYRLASIKNINLNYRHGMEKIFVHVYGELHGMYSEAFASEDDFYSLAVKDHFTYNQSVLLFKGNDVDECLKNLHQSKTYISLSPLIVDLSVYLNKDTQTPEIYYYTGQNKRQYHFAHYKNELQYGKQSTKKSNKWQEVKKQNNKHPKLEDLYDHIEEIFNATKEQTS